MRRAKTCRVWVRALAAGAVGMAFAAAADGDVAFTRNGSAIMSNELVAIRLSGQPGAAKGIQAFRFLPTGFEMVDVLYGQTDYVKGHILGEQWDAAETGDPARPGGVPGVGGLYVPVEHGAAADGSAMKLVQVSEGAYRWERTTILRRDCASVELRYRLTNIKGDRRSFSLRFHGAASPGARGRYQRQDDFIFLNTVSNVLALDQTLNNDQYRQAYGDDKFFTAERAKEPARAWVRPAGLRTPVLTENWAAWVNRVHGDGMVFIFDDASLLGFYNCPGITLEPVMKTVSLKPGESWEFKAYVGAFTGAKDKKVVAGTPLYVVTKAPETAKGVLAGEIIPLFSGKLRVLDAEGKPAFEADARCGQAVALQGRVGEKPWALEARDSRGIVIGSVASDGRVALSEPQVAPVKTKKPSVSGRVHMPHESLAAVEAFLAPRDFTAQCGAGASDREKELAGKIAARLGVGICSTSLGGKLLVVGEPAANGIVRDVGLLRNSVGADWPGAGRGAILVYDNYEATEQPLLLVGGSDGEGAAKAAEYFVEKVLAKEAEPKGFIFWPVGLDRKVYPYSRPPLGVTNRIALHMARGEYESAQAAITAFEAIEDVVVSNTPLVSAATGKPIDRKYSTRYRSVNGPVWIRWVNNYPLEPEKWEKGWTGHPDPLLEWPETAIPAGTSQGVWLTFITSENCAPGLYRCALICRANGGERKIDVELTVWDFTIPNKGLIGDPYMYMDGFPGPGDPLRERDIEALVRNMVEHYMGCIHLPSGLFRWHVNTNGVYKGISFDWLESSTDGMLALDASQFDWLVELMDKTAAPNPLRYMLYSARLDDGRGELKQLPAGRTGEDQFAMFKKHLDRKGWAKRVSIKLADEPIGFDWWWNKCTEAPRKAGLPIMTAFNSIDYKEAEKGIGWVSPWQVLYMQHNQEFFDRAKKAGDLVSWYNCGPPPMINIGAKASELRGYLWQAAKADLDLISWWGIQVWQGGHHEVWYNRYSHHNSVMYPEHPTKGPWQKKGKGWVDKAPLDSMRWELIREGMEDARYVNLLRALIAQAREKGLKDAAGKAQAVLDGIWAEVFPTLNDYAPPYGKIVESREKIAAAVLELQAALKPAGKP